MASTNESAGTPEAQADPHSDVALWPPSEAGTPGGWRRRIRGVLGFGAWIVAGVVVGVLATRVSLGITGTQWLVGFVAFMLAMWPNVILHEAGHALAGVMSGQRVFALGIGRWRFERGQAGWRWRKADAVRGIGGFAALAPGEGGCESRRDLAAYLLGGPLANLLTAALGMVLLYRCPLSPWLAAAVSGVSLSALFLGVVNLVPFRSHGWYSDGLNLLHVLRGGKVARLRLRMMHLVGLSLSGVRPRDWPGTLMPTAEAADVGDPLLATGILSLNLIRAIDGSDRETADAMAARLAPRFYEVPEAMRASLAVNIAFHIARFRSDAALLAAWLPHCEGGLLDVSAQSELLRAEHRVLLGEDEYASGHLAQARARLGNVHDAASVVVLTERIEVLEAAIRERAASSGQAVPADAGPV